MLRLLPDLRYLGAGTLLNSIGMMGEVVVLGWLALELTDSPFLVGAAMGARALPLFFVGVPAGVIADRLPRHRLLTATGAGQAVTTALMGVLVLAGAESLTQLILLTFVGGTLRGLEHAARQSYAHDVVGAAGLVSGLAILGVAMRAGWLVGSLGAGAIIARYGSGHAYLFVAAAYLAGALAMLPARAVVPAMQERRQGSIIAIGGQSSLTGRPNTAAVSAAKTGLLGLVRALAAELGPFGIRVNMVVPGFIDTERRYADWYPEFRQSPPGAPEQLKQIPLGRLGRPEDIADACVFLASDASSYITGDAIRVMGGRIIG